MVLILGIMLQIPGIQISVYAIPVWVLVMFFLYLIKPKRRVLVNGGAAGTVAK